ncbi:MAG: energy-coupling factor transporter transmembrane component T family protein [Candidatus Thorarchaeota archaeon]
MASFLLPFREGRINLKHISPTAMLLSALAVGVIISLQTNPLIVATLLIFILFGGAITGTRWRTVLSLVAKFEIVILFWVLLEPFLFGSTVLYSFPMPWGALNVYHEGIILGILLGLRMTTLAILFLITLSHMSLTEFIGALRTLRVPTTILGSLLIMLRYIPLFITERKRMQEAQSLRGFEKGERTERIKSLGFMVGSSIDRAMDRSITVYESMRLRGFGKSMIIRGSAFKRGDSLFIILIIVILFGVFFIIPRFFEVIFV